MYELITQILVVTCITMVQVLQEQYGADSVAQHGIALLLATLTRLFGSLQEAYKGQFLLTLK